ncbi:MAG: PfkB family carbohydrate kinase [Propioniciclava sp.]|uniref:PfkB family carbohydrate kinase n=1 Tax=Propioniciclava sp. TaxID=2038686 RepID=UPI0039E5C3F8
MDRPQAADGGSLRLGMVGIATLDFTCLVERFPQEESEGPMLDNAVTAGGLSGRAALAVARLGEPVRLLAACGSDAFATILKSEIAAGGVDAHWLAYEQPSQHSVVISSREAGSRTIIWKRQPMVTADVAGVVEEFVAELDIVLLDSTDPILASVTVDACRRRGVTTVLDTGSGRPWTASLLGKIDHVIASQKFTGKLTPERGLAAAEALIDPSANTVFAITEGTDGGCWVSGRAGAGSGRWRAHQVAAVDTCGAGDVFHGIYAWGLAQRFTPAEAFEVASLAAATSTTALGNQALPTLNELSDALPSRWRN